MAPGERGYLRSTPPLVLLQIDSEVASYAAKVRRVASSLADALHEDGKLVPYASLELEFAQEERPTLLTAVAGTRLAFGVPRNMTPNRFPDFELLRDFVEWICNPPEGAQERGGAKALRNHAYEQRVGRGGLPAALWAVGGRSAPPGLGGIQGWLLETLFQPAFRTLPRWLWARHRSRKLVRGWLGAALRQRASHEGLFEVLENVASVQRNRLDLPADHAQHREALQVLEELLVRSLLADLNTPAVGRLLPKQRRRTARPVLLVALPAPDTEGSRAAERFLRAFHQARDTGPAPGPLVIAMGHTSAGLLADLGDPQVRNLTQAGLLLHQRAEPVVLTRLTEESFEAGLPLRRVGPKRYRFGWRQQTALMTVMGLLSTTLLAFGAREFFGWGKTHACLGGDASVAGSDPVDPVSASPQEWMVAKKAIDAENARAEAFERSGWKVRTVAHIGSSQPKGETDAQFNGAVPELRGIALWQHRLNNEAQSNGRIVPLRVEEFEAGAAFKDAEQAAQAVVNKVNNPEGDDSRHPIVGVIGLAQSRGETLKALKTLEQAGIPVAGTTATADEMSIAGTDNTYWPFAPLNSVEARIEARFASTSPIVSLGDPERGCTASDYAIIVKNDADLYSKNLADKFSGEFSKQPQSDTEDFNFDQDPNNPVASGELSSANTLADRVCQEAQRHPRAVVYWATRARDLTAFLNATEGNECSSRSSGLTVMGGNELTNLALAGAFHNKDWLRLYYSAHALPASDHRASEATRKFAKDYTSFMKAKSSGADPWAQDGHSAVAYDALQALSKAINLAAASDDLRKQGVRAALGSGKVNFEGATGHVEYHDPGMPPTDKALVLLKPSPKGPIAVTACGAYTEGQSYSGQPAPCDAY
ncbi:ABC transporter substrate-binding protein [Streptomyces sp. NPDC093097]|uniref:ABC transporter substrate-binding protein n=1 Tax=Streptomyces sp. NPDC093097 TaxID=3366027 RepID=UPI00381B3CEB